MRINSKRALSYFFPNPSYEQVYFEAVANAIDAGATEISICIDIEAYEKPDTLRLTITDNGIGFTELNFRKFSKLLEVNTPDHKGLRRLVFLEYFERVDIVSIFGGNNRRRIKFDMDFDGECQKESIQQSKNGTILTFSNFSGDRIKTYNYLRPEHIRVQLQEHFLPLLFSRKEDDRPLRIDIELKTSKANPSKDFFPDRKTLTLEDLPVLLTDYVEDDDVDWFNGVEVNYSIINDNTRPKSVATVVSVDGRAMPYQLISQDAIPGGYQVLFLLKSELFKVDPSRQKIELSETVSEVSLRRVLRRGINKIVSSQIPAVEEQNKRICVELATKYPHLKGYFSQDTVGLISKDSAIAGAQERFFSDQKSVLECETLDEATYEKALDVSARLLMEYILYRTRIIAKLKSTDISESEGEIHDLIVPRRTTLKCETGNESIFTCNVWLLDDKYMSYTTLLSDQKMTDVMKEISIDSDVGEGRPDITLVFSADPNGEDSGKVDVVVVELKKHGVELAKEEEVVSQLRQRARRLLKFYPDKINRIWFYGITDISPEFRVSLIEDEFRELFSHGQVFYKPQTIIVGSEEEKFPIDLYVMNFDAFIKDAESRNSTFLNMLKQCVAQVAESESTSAMSKADSTKSLISQKPISV